MAQTCLPLFQQPERWIHRRVDRISYHDLQAANHEVSVDFTLPAGMPSVGSFNGADVFIAPLFLLRKGPTHPKLIGPRPRRRFLVVGERRRPRVDRPRAIPTAYYSDMVLVDQEDTRQPVLTQRQSKLLSALMLWDALDRALGVRLSTRSPLKSALWTIATRNWRDLEDTLDEVFKHEVESSDHRVKLRNDSAFRELVYTLASHYIVFAIFMRGPQGRTVYRLSYTEATTSGGRESIRRRLFRRLAWKSAILFVPINEVGAAASYKVEIQFPSELAGNAVGLIGTRYERFRNTHRRRSTQNDYFIQQVDRTSEGSIYVPTPLPGRRVGSAWVKLRVRREGFGISALLSSLMVAIVLALAALLAPEVVKREQYDAAMAVLLLLPAGITAFVARTDLHPITTRVLLLPRLALLFDVALLFLSSFFILAAARNGSVGFSLWEMPEAERWLSHTFDLHPEVRTLLAVLCVLSVVIAIYITSILIFPMPRGNTEYKPLPSTLDPRSGGKQPQAPPLKDKEAWPAPVWLVLWAGNVLTRWRRRGKR